jgi:hypothetical protein
MVIDGPCSGTARYSSACSSVSVSKRTTTPPSPVTTITQTAPTRKTTLSITTTTTYSTTATVTAGSTYVDNIPCGKTLNGPGDNYPYSIRSYAVPWAATHLHFCDPMLSGTGMSVKNADDTFASTSSAYKIPTYPCPF